jgi:hypothetical protein
MIVKCFISASKNRWILWGAFGLGFFLPPFFLLFLPLAALKAWKELRSEYEDVARYWESASEGALQSILEQEERGFQSTLFSASPA